MKKLPEHLADFISNVDWVFAKTYAKTWPHEYIVRDKVNENLFVKLVKHTRKYGYTGKFYKKDIPYCDIGEMVYWTMGDTIDNTIIINRCKKEQSYEYRLANNDLPN